MRDYTYNKIELEKEGFSVVKAIYQENQIAQIISLIENAEGNKSTFRKSKDLFAIRQFLKEIPDVLHLIFNEKLQQLIQSILGNDYFVVKSIYFDKPKNSNWYVAYHQDLTISVDQKIDLENYSNWTVKQNQFAVQPPIEVLENITTLRIHLDDTNENNGALKVIPKSHLKQIYRPETIDWQKETEISCSVEKGGIMLMKPLILHSSSRTTNKQRRRVIHIELSNMELLKGINWAEKMELNF